MYEELISRLLSLYEIDAIQQEPGICRITMECIGAIKEIAIEAADAIEELSKAQEQWIVQERNALLKSIPRWIPVTERLPDGEVGVLCYCSRNGQYGCGEWCKEDNGTIYWIGLNGMIPTHWMPLPEPPKEET